MPKPKKVANNDGKKKKKKDSVENSKERSSYLKDQQSSNVVNQEEPIPSDKEFDIDSVVIRSSTRRKLTILDPKSVSIDNSRLYAVVQEYPLIALPDDLILFNFGLMSAKESIYYLGKITKHENHDENLSSFWYLDILAEILRQGQMKGVNNGNLKTICLWFDQFIKTLTVYGYSREEFFSCFNEMICESEVIYSNTGNIPLPQDVLNIIKSKKKELALGMIDGITSLIDLLNGMQIVKSPSYFMDSSKNYSDLDFNLIGENDLSTIKVLSYDNFYHEEIDGEQELVLEEEYYEDCTKFSELSFLTEQFYNVFGNQFKYEVIRTVFSQPPQLTPLTILDNFNFPKTKGMSISQTLSLNLKEKKEIPKTRLKLVKSAISQKSLGSVPESNVERFKREMLELDMIREEANERNKIKDKFLIPQEDGVDDKFFKKIFPPKKKKSVTSTKSLLVNKSKKKKK